MVVDRSLVTRTVASSPSHSAYLTYEPVFIALVADATSIVVYIMLQHQGVMSPVLVPFVISSPTNMPTTPPVRKRSQNIVSFVPASYGVVRVRNTTPRGIAPTGGTIYSRPRPLERGM